MRTRPAAASPRVLSAADLERDWGADLSAEAQRQARARGFRGVNWYELRPPLEAACLRQDDARLALPGEEGQALQVATAAGTLLLYCSEQTYIARLERLAGAFSQACAAAAPLHPGHTRRELAAALWRQAAVYYGAAEGWERLETMAGQLAAAACAWAAHAGARFGPLDVLALLRDAAVRPPAGAGAAVAAVCTAIGRSAALSGHPDGCDPPFTLHAPQTRAFLTWLAAAWEASDGLRPGGKGPQPPLVPISDRPPAAARLQTGAAGEAASTLAEAAAAMICGRKDRAALIAAAAALLAAAPGEHAAPPPWLLEGGMQLALLAAALALEAGGSQERAMPAVLQELFAALVAGEGGEPLRCSAACALLARSCLDGGGRAAGSVRQVRAWLEQAAAQADRLGPGLFPLSDAELRQAIPVLKEVTGALPAWDTGLVSAARLQEQGRRLFLHEQPQRCAADGSALYLRAQSHEEQLVAVAAELLQDCAGLSAAGAPSGRWERAVRLCAQLRCACRQGPMPAMDFIAAAALPLTAAAACLAGVSAAAAAAAPAALLAMLRGLTQEDDGGCGLQLLLRLGTDCGLDEAAAAPAAAAGYYAVVAAACTRMAALSPAADADPDRARAPDPAVHSDASAPPHPSHDRETAALEVVRLWEDSAGQRPGPDFDAACGTLLWQVLTSERSGLCSCLDEIFMALLRQRVLPWLAASLAAADAAGRGRQQRRRLAGLVRSSCQAVVHEAAGGGHPALGGAATLLRLMQGWQELHGRRLQAGGAAALCSRVQRVMGQFGEADGGMSGGDDDVLLAALLPRCLGATAEQAAMLSCGDQLLAMAPAGRCRQLRAVDEGDGAELIWCNRGASGRGQRRLIITEARRLVFERDADGSPNPTYESCLRRGDGFCCAVAGAPSQLLGGLLAAEQGAPLACQYRCALRTLVRRCREAECQAVLSEFEHPVLLGVTATPARRPPAARHGQA